MKTRRVCCLLGLFLVFAADLSAKPAGPSHQARERLVLYQAETRGALSRSGWRIAGDRPGSLVATHSLGLQGANFGNPMPDTPMMAYLMIRFEARTAEHTDCVASIVEYIGFKSVNDHQRHWMGPMPFDTPESKKRIQDIMAEAEGRLGKNHPEYAAK